MKRLTPAVTGYPLRGSTGVERGQCRTDTEVSRGARWHRRTQEGKPNLDADRAGGDPGAQDPDPARPVCRRAGPSSAGTDPDRGVDGERVVGTLSRGAGTRGDRGGSQLRADVRHAQPTGR